MKKFALIFSFLFLWTSFSYSQSIESSEDFGPGSSFKLSDQEEIDFSNVKWNLTKNIYVTTLSNGLKVIIKEVPLLPIAGVGIAYDVGFRYEDINGKTGLTHLVEHLLFQSTKKYPRGEIARSLQTAGAHFNAFTTYGMTGYYSILPLSSVDLVMEIESERMQNALFLEDEFQKEKQVVLSELRTAYSSPSQKLFSKMLTNTYNVHPVVYGAGKIEDVAKSTRNYVYNDIYKKYYVPNNATLVVVADMDKKEILDKIQKYFGNIPKGEAVQKEKDALSLKNSIQQVEMEGEANSDFGYSFFDAPAFDSKNKDFATLYFLSESGMVDPFGLLDTIDGSIGISFYNEKDHPFYPANMISKNYFENRFEDEKIKFVYEEQLSYQNTEEFLLGLLHWSSYKKNIDDYEDLMQNILDLTASPAWDVVQKYLTKENAHNGFYTTSNKKEKKSNDFQKSTHQAYKADFSFLKSKDPIDEKKALYDRNKTYNDVKELLDKQFKNIKEWELRNGVQLIHAYNPLNDSVNIVVGFHDAGYLSQEIPGQTALTANWIFEGGPQILLKDELEQRGSSFSTYIAQDYVVYNIHTRKEDFEKAMQFVKQMTQDRVVLPLLLEEWKDQAIRDLDFDKNSKNPDLRLSQELNKTLLGKQGYGLDLYAKADDYLKIKEDDLKIFYKRHYRPENMVISISGNVSYDEVAKLSKDNIEDWQVTSEIYIKPDFVLQDKVRNKKVRLDLLENKVGFIAPTIDSDDFKYYAAMQVADSIFSGSGLSSRLMRSIRDEYGLTYGVYSSIVEYGPLNAYILKMLVSKENENKAFSLLEKELEVYHKYGPTPIEVYVYERFLMNNLVFEYSDSYTLANHLLHNEMQFFNYKKDIEYLDLLRNMDKKDIDDSIMSFFPVKLSRVIVGK